VKRRPTPAAWHCAAALALLALGVALSRQLEPGVRIETATVAGDTPALVFHPTAAGPHPVALLAHGVTASKETLFRFGEALAAAGFTSVAIDLPGHGRSARSFLRGGNAAALEQVDRELGAVDVFVGHSMGAYAGAEGVRNGRLQPRLFIAIGALPALGHSGVPLLLLAGRYEEAVSPARLRAHAAAPLVVSDWSDHALEPYDPVLIAAGVAAACRTVGLPPAAAPTCWRWRLLGLALALCGALALGDRLPAAVPRLRRVRGPLLASVVIATTALAAGSWLGAAPSPWRVPVQLILTAGATLVIAGAGALRLPRWSFAAVMALCLGGCLATGAYFPALFVLLIGLLLGAGALLGALAERDGTRLDGDLAMAILVGYAVGQWLPIIY
jgi:pimeloyl-ACP methyl ester carboxylesterase